MKIRSVTILLAILVLAGFLGYRLELILPRTAPSISKTYTSVTQSPPNAVGSYDVLGHVVGKAEAERLLETEEGQELLSADNGAVEITQDLIDLGRDTFYRETFGNEVLFTDIVGVLDGPLNIGSISKAVLALKGTYTSNLQIPLERDLTVGDKPNGMASLRTFKAGTVLNTGLDVPRGSLFPLGLVTHVKQGQLKVGVSCALCHAAVNENTGKIMEGATNTDINASQLLALASNTAALFRQTDVNPAEIATGEHTYINSDGEEAYLPNPQMMEDEVDAAMLAWPPGNFVSNGDLHNNSAKIPSSYTYEAYPYAWSGVASIGWFHGLTTLNNAVFGLNADPTTTADAAETVLGIDKEIYLGTMLQNAADAKFRLPEAVSPSEFLTEVDPTPGSPGINWTIKLPEYPQGSLFMQNGLMAATPGLPVASQLNGMSAWQNTLAPPPYKSNTDKESLQRGAKVFQQANCAKCHSGRYFTNHQIIPVREIGTQPARAPASAGFAKLFVPPDTYPPNASVPLPAEPPILPIPTDITPQEDIKLAYAQSDREGGYKVIKLIGLYLHAPYLHDGGVAASEAALKQNEDGYYSIDIDRTNEIGMVGTLMQGIKPDPDASLRMLVDRSLREPMVAANRANADLQRANVDGSGHAYWVDKQAGFTGQQQNDLINFLLSLDNDPEVLPSNN